MRGPEIIKDRKTWLWCASQFTVCDLLWCDLPDRVIPVDLSSLHFRRIIQIYVPGLLLNPPVCLLDRCLSQAPCSRGPIVLLPPLICPIRPPPNLSELSATVTVAVSSRVDFVLQGCLAHMKTHSPLGPPYHPRHSPSVGSWG